MHANASRRRPRRGPGAPRTARKAVGCAPHARYVMSAHRRAETPALARHDSPQHPKICVQMAGRRRQERGLRAVGRPFHGLAAAAHLRSGPKRATRTPRGAGSVSRRLERRETQESRRQLPPGEAACGCYGQRHMDRWPLHMLGRGRAAASGAIGRGVVEWVEAMPQTGSGARSSPTSCRRCSVVLCVDDANFGDPVLPGTRTRCPGE